MRLGRPPALAALLCALLARPGVAQEAVPAALPQLDGVVLASDGRPVADADVGLLGLGAARTDSLGRFAFRGLPVGTFLVRVQRLGYSPLVQAVSYDGEHAEHVRLRFGEAATLLAPVVVRDSAIVGRGVGFDQRRRTGQGVYLSERDITQRGAQRVEHLLGQLPGVRVDSSGTVKMDRGRTSILGDDCASGVQLLIDGAAVGPGFDLRAMSPGSIRGIEVYRSVATTPVELRSARMVCGTIAIWTK